METYGFIIQTNGEISISGDPFIESSPTSYQIIRSTYFSLIWNKDSKYTLYFVKYPIARRDYLTFALNCSKDKTWTNYIVTQFTFSYENNPFDIKNKMLTVTSNNKEWKVAMNVLKQNVRQEENNQIIMKDSYVLSLPYVVKNTVYNKTD